jgi:L-rhamnose mutarotase
MDIYLLGRTLVMVVEMPDGLDYREAFSAHAASSQRVAEWEQLKKSLQEPAPGARAGEWWAVMEPVFHLSQGAAGPEPTEQQEPAIAHVADRSRTS